MLHVGPRPRHAAAQAMRVVFAALWIGGQAALILTARLRADRIFGFRMFPEASTIEVHLKRDVGGSAVAVPRGDWKAADRNGAEHDFSWRDRVRDPTLATLDTRLFASYGAEAQLARLQRALDDVADHITDDAQTRSLSADVLVWKNGRDPVTVTLSSHVRPGV